MNSFVFNGVNSADFGIYISGSGTFNFPQRVIQTVDIPGRSGSLTVDNGRFLNIQVSYPAFIRRDFTRNVDGVKAWLLSSTGYQRLTDSYHPDFFRMARFTGPADFTTRFLNYSGEITLAFDCMPQRFYQIGQQTMQIPTGTILKNPSFFEAKPLITVYGNAPGILNVGGVVVSILSLTDYLVIDCDSQNAYKGTQNLNQTVSAPVFPVLGAGETEISFSGGIQRVEMIPRWWTV